MFDSLIGLLNSFSIICICFGVFYFDRRINSQINAFSCRLNTIDRFYSKRGATSIQLITAVENDNELLRRDVKNLNLELSRMADKFNYLNEMLTLATPEVMQRIVEIRNQGYEE